MDKKKLILVILAIVAIPVWIHGLSATSRNRSRAMMSSQKNALPSSDLEGRQAARSAYKDWGRNPFSASRAASGGVAGMQLGGIIYDAKQAYALINDQIVHVGERIGENRVVEIKQDRVILNDGSKDIELKLQ